MTTPPDKSLVRALEALARVESDMNHKKLTNRLKDFAEIRLALQSAPQWRTIESAPRDGTEILVSALGDISIAIYLDKDWFCRSDAMMVEDIRGDYKKVYPEYWQPLPLPPKDEKEKG